MWNISSGFTSTRCFICWLTKNNVYSGWPSPPCLFYLLSLWKRGGTGTYMLRKSVGERVKEEERNKGAKWFRIDQGTSSSNQPNRKSLSSASRAQTQQQRTEMNPRPLDPSEPFLLLKSSALLAILPLLDCWVGLVLAAGLGSTAPHGTVPFPFTMGLKYPDGLLNYIMMTEAFTFNTL